MIIYVSTLFPRPLFVFGVSMKWSEVYVLTFCCAHTHTHMQLVRRREKAPYACVCVRACRVNLPGPSVKVIYVHTHTHTHAFQETKTTRRVQCLNINKKKNCFTRVSLYTRVYIRIFSDGSCIALCYISSALLVCLCTRGPRTLARSPARLTCSVRAQYIHPGVFVRARDLPVTAPVRRRHAAAPLDSYFINELLLARHTYYFKRTIVAAAVQKKKKNDPCFLTCVRNSCVCVCMCV